MNCVFIQIWSHKEDFVLREIRRELVSQGHSVGVMYIAKSDDKLLELEEFESCLKSFNNPDRIIWLATTGFVYMSVWDKPEWQDVQKIALFFDDPVHRVKDQMMEGVMRDVATRKDFHVGIWDGYWRGQAKELWGLDSHEIHLSADIEEFKPNDDNPMPDKIVFVGMLHSHNYINGLFKLLSRPAQLLVKAIDDEVSRITFVNLKDEADIEMSRAEELIRIFDAKHGVMNSLKISESRKVRWIVWALAKNSKRIVMLRRTDPSKLAIFSEMEQLGHANEPELRVLLGDKEGKIEIVDTSNWHPESLAKVYSYGALHIQATDPQSVEGGIPYRVFQTAACEKALLTDRSEALAYAFEEGEEIFFYGDYFWRSYKAALKTTLTLGCMKEFGMAARERFLEEHTWKHRLDTIEGWMSKEPESSVPVVLSSAH